jgi:hypothetical protein
MLNKKCKKCHNCDTILTKPNGDPLIPYTLECEICHEKNFCMKCMKHHYYKYDNPDGNTMSICNKCSEKTNIDLVLFEKEFKQLLDSYRFDKTTIFPTRTDLIDSVYGYITIYGECIVFQKLFKNKENE